jgi:hypothetical protein
MKGTFHTRRFRRLSFAAATLVLLAAGALIGATTAAADAAFSQTSAFTYMGTNSCTGDGQPAFPLA